MNESKKNWRLVFWLVKLKMSEKRNDSNPFYSWKTRTTHKNNSVVFNNRLKNVNDILNDKVRQRKKVMEKSAKRHFSKNPTRKSRHKSDFYKTKATNAQFIRF